MGSGQQVCASGMAGGCGKLREAADPEASRNGKQQAPGVVSSRRLGTSTTKTMMQRRCKSRPKGKDGAETGWKGALRRTRVNTPPPAATLLLSLSCMPWLVPQEPAAPAQEARRSPNRVVAATAAPRRPPALPPRFPFPYTRAVVDHKSMKPSMRKCGEGQRPVWMSLSVWHVLRPSRDPHRSTCTKIYYHSVPPSTSTSTCEAMGVNVKPSNPEQPRSSVFPRYLAHCRCWLACARLHGETKVALAEPYSAIQPPRFLRGRFTEYNRE
ncbi:hypothetical protein B0J14DRAFT_570880 [Halenospora varia]|nr:hypothetical protein B0J14DRAFT_570880 [Halenospora varia]